MREPDPDTSPEFKKFEDYVRRVLAIPKTELDRRLALERSRKKLKHKRLRWPKT